MSTPTATPIAGIDRRPPTSDGSVQVERLEKGGELRLLDDLRILEIVELPDLRVRVGLDGIEPSTEGL